MPPKGQKMPESAKVAISKAKLGKKRPDMIGENNPNWHGEEYTIKGARFMAWKLYHDICPEGKQIHHIDGNPKNNDPSNIQFLTYEEHMKVHNMPERFREMNKNRPRTWSPEGLEKLRQAHIGLKQSPETIAKRVAKIKGKPHKNKATLVKKSAPAEAQA